MAKLIILLRKKGINYMKKILPMQALLPVWSGQSLLLQLLLLLDSLACYRKWLPCDFAVSSCTSVIGTFRDVLSFFFCYFTQTNFNFPKADNPCFWVCVVDCLPLGFTYNYNENNVITYNTRRNTESILIIHVITFIWMFYSNFYYCIKKQNKHQ